jgi:glutamate dehydrogenase
VLQNLALSIAQAMPADYLDAQMGLIRRLEAEDGLDRALSLLPTDEAIAERRQDGFGLTRPEMAVLLAHTKNALFERLLATPAVDESYLAGDLAKYFPRQLRRGFGDAIAQHRLRREIVATWLANSLVNRGLDVFAFDMMEVTGRELEDVALAYVLARDAFGLLPLWSGIESLDAVPAATQIALLMQARTVTVDGTAWFLGHLDPAVPMADMVARFRAGIDAVVTALPETLPEAGAMALGKATRDLEGTGLAADLAARLAALPYFVAACDIIEVARDAGTEVADAARAYFALDAALELDRTRRALADVAIHSRWDRLVATGLEEDLNHGLRRLTARVLANGGPALDAVRDWLDRSETSRRRHRHLVADIDAAPAPDLAMLGVAVRALRDLAAR